MTQLTTTSASRPDYTNLKGVINVLYNRITLQSRILLSLFKLVTFSVQTASECTRQPINKS